MSQGINAEILWREQIRERELRALSTNTLVEEECAPAWKYQLHLGATPETCLRRIIEVVEIVIKQPRHQWPDETQWRAMFPDWFNEQTHSYSLTEVEAMLASTPREHWHELSWDFDSWIDVIREREWQWCCYEYTPPIATIYLGLTCWPANLRTLEHIFRTAGAQIEVGEFLAGQSTR